MDDRIAEIREAVERQRADLLVVAGDLARIIEGFDPKDKTTWGVLLNDKVTVIDAAQELVGLLDSDALIIRRDENGKWPDAVLDWIETYLGQYDWQTALRAFDALASSQGAEPDRGPIPYMMFGETLDEAQKRIEGVEPQ